MPFGNFNVALKERATVAEPRGIEENEYGHKHPAGYEISEPDLPIKLFKIQGEFDRMGFETSENWVVGTAIAIVSLKAPISDNAIITEVRCRDGSVIFRNAKIRRHQNELNHKNLYLVGEIPGYQRA